MFIWFLAEISVIFNAISVLWNDLLGSLSIIDVINIILLISTVYALIIFIRTGNHCKVRNVESDE